MVRPYYDNKIYNKGDKVIYFHQVWKSLIDNNIYKPRKPYWISIKFYNYDNIFRNKSTFHSCYI